MIYSRAVYNLMRTKNYIPFLYCTKRYKLKYIELFSSKKYFSTNLTSKVINTKDNYSNSEKENEFPLNDNAIKPTTMMKYGQPTSFTHPHILQDGEITPGIHKYEFKRRRELLMENIYKYSKNTNPQFKNHVIIIPSSTKKYMSDKIPYVFRQNSDFLYLTGCLEPDTVLVLIINDKEIMKSVLLMRPKNLNAELWDGPRTGVQNAINYFGVDEAYDVGLIKNFLNRYFYHNDSFVLWYDQNRSDLTKITDIINDLKRFSSNISIQESPTEFVHKLRLIKSKIEIELMRKTCRIASDSINETIKETKSGDTEHQIFAKIDYKCRMKNANHLAYPPVVASGQNATIIHYINNTQMIKDGDLILMDAGCEYGGYSSDITRTWPVNGHFTEAQKILYEVVLLVQKELIDNLLKNGGKTLDELFDTMCLKLGKYLKEICLLPNNLNQIELARAAYNFCPHHVSHYLGMDVHDTPLISRSTKLLPGMICTVEPGIYIASHRKDVPPEFRGIGVRIEDDVLIASDNSVEVLTDKCCKEIKDIENLFL